MSVLPDIEAFRDLLLSFAKSGWLETHKGRKRVPKGFDVDFNLDLVAIEDGSAVPVLQLSSDRSQGRLPGMVDANETVLNKAYENVSMLIHTAANDTSFRPVLTRDQISAFNRFGSGLRDDEKVEFLNHPGPGGEVVSLDVYRRKDLLMRLRETYERRYSGGGTLIAVSADGRISIQTDDFGPVTIDVGDRAVEEFDGSLLSAVTLDITLELDADDRVRSVKDVHSVDIHDPLSQAARAAIGRSIDRVDQLLKLDAGWLDGDGAIVTQPAASQAKVILEAGAAWFAAAGIFPTPEGGIQIETQRETAELTITINPDGTVTGYLVAAKEAQEEREEELVDQYAVIAALERLAEDEEIHFAE